MNTLHTPEHHLDSGKNFNKHHGPYYKRMHKDWRIWVGVVIILVAISIYIVTVDFSIQPAATQVAR
jgi:hypothetical protein